MLNSFNIEINLIAMAINVWVQKVLSENGLADVIGYMRSSGDEQYCLDRHIVDTRQDIPKELQGGEKSFYESAFLLCEKWCEEKKIFGDGLYFSGPFVIVEDAWLQGDASAAPPHVKMMMSKSILSSDALVERDIYRTEKGLDHVLAELSRERGFVVWRLKDSVYPEASAWIFFKSCT